MAPVTQLGLVFLTTASVALAERHAHARGHRHVNRRQNRPYLTAPYGFDNGTATAGPTGTGLDQTRTRTETLTSTLTQTLTAPGQAYPSGGSGSGEVPVGEQSEGTCGGTVYVTATNTVTVTATPGAPETTADSGSGDDSEETPVTSVASSSSAPAYSGPAYSAPETTSSVEAPTTSAPAASSPAGYYASQPETPSSSSEAAPVPTTAASSSEVPTYSASSYEAPAPTTSAQPTTSEAPSSSSSSAASTPTGYSGGSGSTGLKTKRGCLYEAGKNDCSALTSSGQLSWITNWGDSPDGSSDGLTFIPQLWGKTAANGWDYTTNWKDNCQKALDNGAPAILGFNEPNIAGQANLSPSDAASVWKDHIATPFGSSGKILVSPGVTSEQSGPEGNKVFPGLDWLSSFKGAGASWGATAVHMYANCAADANDQVTYLKAMVDEAGKRFSLPVWVTEFGCDPSSGGSADQQAAFIKAAVEYLEGESNVKQYAAFKADTLAGNAAGSTYATMDSTTPS